MWSAVGLILYPEYLKYRVSKNPEHEVTWKDIAISLLFGLGTFWLTLTIYRKEKKGK